MLLTVSPTAKTLLLDEAATPLRTPVLSAGTVAADQVVPLKVSIRAPVSPLARVPEPTATTSVGEIAATAAGVKPETLVTAWKPLRSCAIRVDRVPGSSWVGIDGIFCVSLGCSPG